MTRLRMVWEVAHRKGLAATCSLVVLCMITPAQAQRPILTHHVREAVANGHAPLVGVLPLTRRMHLAIILPIRNQADLDSFLRDLYDPRSPSYHRYLSVQEFTERFGPTQESYDAVVEFAEANGMTVEETPVNRRFVAVDASVAQVENAFHLNMGVYLHPRESRTFFAPDREPTVDLDVPLWHIAGLDDFSLRRPTVQMADSGKTGSGSAQGSGPNGWFLGSDRRAAYYGGTALTGSGQTVGLFEEDGYNLSDVQAYFNKAGQPLNVPINNVLVLNPNSGSDGDDREQVVDIIEAISMAPGLSQVRVYITYRGSDFTPGFTDTETFNKMAVENIAKQLSVSWVWSPDDPSFDDPVFEEFASQGQSLFVASGDWSSFPNSTGWYYPAEDAYVTAVGGTELTTNGPGGSWYSETAWGGTINSCLAPATGSGGGVSPDSIEIPDYQAVGAVINAPDFQGSKTLRNIPDVAAQANCDNYSCFNGTCGGLGGTSLAAPTWAGFMALVNQQSAENGESPDGFLNPFLYFALDGDTQPGYNAAFHDITTGTNGAYTAVAGYDLVTGLGSPNGQNLITAIAPGFYVSAAGSATATSVNPATYSVTVSPRSGFTGTVTLSVYGLPAGVTGTFNPSSINGASGTSTLTVSASTATPLGSYILTITGAGGGLSHSTSVTLIVDFAIQVTPSSQTVGQGSTVVYSVTVPPAGGFTGNIALQVSGGLGGCFPSCPYTIAGGSGSTQLWVSTTKSTSTGTYTETITGTSGSLSQTASATTLVQPAYFSLSLSPIEQNVVKGQNTTFIVSVSGSICAKLKSTVLTFSNFGYPLTGTFNPVSIAGCGTSTLTVGNTASGAGGMYFLVTGSDSFYNQTDSVQGEVVITN